MRSRVPFLKTLRLVTPQIANRLRIPAEAPVFISSVVAAPHRCGHCSVVYSPLLYAIDRRLTQAQHYHATCGGIYFAATRSLSRVAASVEQCGFIGHVVPLGNTMFYEDIMGEPCGRSAAVVTQAITVVCQYKATCFDGLRRRHQCDRMPLTEGFLVEHPVPLPVPCRVSRACQPGTLLPVCPASVLSDRVRALFRFTVRDGQLLFSKRPPP